MATAAPSIFSLAAVGVYLLVLSACVAASIAARKFRQPSGHRRAWALIAGGFLVLALVRLTGLEEGIRDWLRELLSQQGAYEERRSFQRPLAAALFATLAAAIALGLLRQWYLVRGRRNAAVVIALAGFAMMVMLLGLRMVSLHQVDKLLYGPLKLNWVADLGASATVLAAALMYLRYVFQRP